MRGKNQEGKASRESAPGPARRFEPPTVEQVAEYCRERKNAVDAGRFVDFYTSKGWKVGAEPMKDWRACVRTWEKRDGDRPPARASPGDLREQIIANGNEFLRRTGGAAS